MAVWIIWFGVCVVLAFAIFETLALYRGTPTLSRTVWIISAKWPPFGWFCGFTTGFLVCHFWWGGIVCFAPVN